MKKVVVRLDLHDDKGKRKAMKTVSTIRGIDSIAIDMKDKKMTVIGDVDPVKIAGKLRKMWHTEIVFVGPAKEPEKKEEPKKEESKNEDAKKGEGKKEEPNKKVDVSKEEGEKKEEPKKQGEKKMDPNEHILELFNSCEAYNPHLSTYYYVLSAEDNPNACIIS